MILSNILQGFSKVLSGSIVVGILSPLGAFYAVEISPVPSSTLLSLPRGAIAQATVSDFEVTNYAKSILDIEPKRQEAYEEIKRIIGSVPPIDCYNSNSLNALNPQIRGIAQNYCQQSETIVTSNGLSNERFNEITRLQQSNPQLQQRIRTEILRIQQERAQS